MTVAVAPMLARLTRVLPVGDGWCYEPKWDGFRCIVTRDGDAIDLRSRSDRPLARYFPELAVAGLRWLNGQPGVLGSLLLGLYDDGGALRHVGVVASFAGARRRELVADVLPFVAPLNGHPWEHGFGLEASPVGRLPGAVSRWRPGEELTWVPLRPDLVAEVAYDHLQGDRFRHVPKFRRWRTDRDPHSCTYDQFDELPAEPLATLVDAP